MEVDVQELIDSNEKTIFNFAENCNSSQGYILLTESQCVHELEKFQLIIEQKDKEIAYLKQQDNDLRQQINDLREINILLKKK